MNRLLLALALAVPICIPANAHHSFAEYDGCRIVSIDGEVERVSWTNPHVILMVRIDEEQSYLVQWSGVSELQRAGIEAHTLKVGDRVIVSGSPNRDADVHILSLITVIRRPSDGLKWTKPRSVAENCAG